jgi:AcrR family transcriptional regulator
MRPSRSDHLVQTALQLFMSDGFHATGIDAILAEAGCAKMTLYNHFKSKNELIVAALERRDRAWREWLQEAVERRASSPRDRMLAIFVALEEWYRRDFRGCAFINASAEYSRRNHPIHRAAARHKAQVHRYVCGLAASAGAAAPRVLADQLCLLIEGATVLAQVTGDATQARKARRAAATLIKGALGGRTAAPGRRVPAGTPSRRRAPRRPAR